MPFLSRPTTIVALGFAAVGLGIALNALWLQSGHHHPAPLFATRETLTPQEPDELVRAVQADLREAGLYLGAVDGLSGPQTVAAIQGYQTASGLDATGRASRELLARLDEDGKAARLARTRPAPGEFATGALQPAEPAADPGVAAVQQALSTAAYGPLNADGVFGEQTRQAIRRFQADHGLPVTGEISDALMVELRSAGALSGG